MTPAQTAQRLLARARADIRSRRYASALDLITDAIKMLDMEADE